MPPTAPAVPQATNSGQALSNLQQFQSGMQAPGDILKSNEDSLGVSGAQSQVSGLRQAITNTTNLLNNVAPGVMGRTQNSLVTSAQANRQIQNEQAPISTDLSKENTDYGNANADLTSLLSQATNRANLDLTGQSQQLSALQNIYDTLYKSEQDKKASDFASAQEAERVREFNAQLANSGSGGISLGGGQSSGFSLPMRVPGDPSQGFNFGSNGNALAYSQAQNIPFRTLLQQMASAGDKGAAAGLQFIGNDGNADPTKITSPALVSLYHSLTGRNVGINLAGIKPTPVTLPANFLGGSGNIPIFGNQMPSIPKFGS